MNGEKNLGVLIKNMQPVLNEGEYVFCSVLSKKNLDFDKVFLLFKEKEGLTIVITKEYADKKGLEYTSIFAWITLHVHSSLDAVGLTAAFSTALAENNISCNVIAGFYHDHIFVQNDTAQKAKDILLKLSSEYSWSMGFQLGIKNKNKKL